MGRAILPEVILAVLVLGIVGVVLVGIGVAQWVAGAAVVTRIKQGRRRRVLERELAARRAARWESRTRYQRGYAVVDVVRVARWDGNETITEADDQDPVVVPEGDIANTAAAQLEADLRADRRNRQAQ